MNTFSSCYRLPTIYYLQPTIYYILSTACNLLSTTYSYYPSLFTILDSDIVGW